MERARAADRAGTLEAAATAKTVANLTINAFSLSRWKTEANIAGGNTLTQRGRATTAAIAEEWAPAAEEATCGPDAMERLDQNSVMCA